MNILDIQLMCYEMNDMHNTHNHIRKYNTEWEYPTRFYYVLIFFSYIYRYHGYGVPMPVALHKNWYSGKTDSTLVQSKKKFYLNIYY